MMKPRRLPRLGGASVPQNQNVNPNVSLIPNPETRNKRRNQEEDLLNTNSDPDFIRKYRRMRNRHQEDFAINLVPNKEDIISEDARLYDNKNINLEVPRIKENIGLESIYWYVYKENIRAIKFYDKNGYKRATLDKLFKTFEYTDKLIKSYVWYQVLK